MRWIHPSNRRLQLWLQSGEPAKVDDHVTTCVRCANRLDELAIPAPELAAALSASLRVPDDLVERLGVRMTQSMRNREDLQMFLALMGISWPTVRNLMTEDEG